MSLESLQGRLEAHKEVVTLIVDVEEVIIKEEEEDFLTNSHKKKGTKSIKKRRNNFLTISKEEEDVGITKSLKELASKNIVQGLPKIDGISEVCEECQLGKQHRETFPSKSKWESHSPLELVHTDLCGPMHVPSLRDLAGSSSWEILEFEDDSSSLQPDIPERNVSPSPSQRRTRSLRDIYDETEEVNVTDQVFFAFFAGEDQITYEEISSIEKNGTWELTTLPPYKSPIGVKWIFKTKTNPDGSINKYKARLIAKGYKQKEGEDFNEHVHNSKERGHTGGTPRQQ